MEDRAFQDLDFPQRRTPRSSTPWTPLLAFVGLVGLSLLVGAAGGAMTATSVHTWYLTLTPPPGTPPNWVFPIVWTTLYLLVGTAAWLVWREPGHRSALLLWGWQLIVGSLWTPAFFGLHSPALGMIVILPMLALILLTIRAFRRHSRLAGGLMLPYAVWTCYATYLNAGFLWLNPA